MVAPQKTLTPEQLHIAVAKVPKLIEETLKLHGITKPLPSEMGRIIKDAISRLSSPEDADMRVKTEQAFLDFLKTKKPAEYDRVSTELNGKKYWDYLGVADMQVNIGGQSIPVKSAIAECAKIIDPDKRMERFVTIMKQVAEMYRLKGSGQNDFGISGGELVSDPARMMADRQMNCFSSSITLGSMLMYAARVAGVGDDIHASIMNIPSHNMEGHWSDAGHAILMVTVGGVRGRGGKEYFFDSTNSIVPNQGGYLESRGSEIVDNRGIGSRRYNRGDTFELGPAITRIAAYQDSLLKKVQGGEMVNDSEIKAISTMPDSFQVKFINALSPEQKRQYFMRTGITGHSPETRFTLASIAVKALEASDKPAERQAALRFAREGAKALEETISTDRVGKLPIASAFGNVISMVNTLSRSSSAQDQALIIRGGMHSFLANAALAAHQDLDKKQLEAGISIIQDYYLNNRGMLEKSNIRFKCVLSLGLARMEDRVHRNEVSPQTQRALETTLASLGVRDVEEYVKAVRRELSVSNPKAGQLSNLDFLIVQHTIGIVAWKAGVEGKDFKRIGIENPSPLTSAVLSTLSNYPSELLLPGSQLHAAVMRARPPSEA